MTFKEAYVGMLFDYNKMYPFCMKIHVPDQEYGYNEQALDLSSGYSFSISSNETITQIDATLGTYNGSEFP